jgi:hydrophobic/amphiphilic exporter-1 (mainly G- bacteria), HAE1 family
MMTAIIERPVATAMVYLAVSALGVFSCLNTPLELAPQEDFPRLDIVSSWPGASPETVQTRVTAPLEQAAVGVKGVRGIRSVSDTGSSRITVELDPQADLEFTRLALREEIAKTERSLPHGVRPSLDPYVPEDFRVRPFLSYTISGNLPLQEIREMVKDRLELGLGSVRGVARVTVTGGSDPELRVVLDREKLSAYDIRPRGILSALSGRLQAFPTGTVREGEQEFSLRISGVIREPDELAETIVGRTGAGSLRLGDLARLVPAYGDISAVNRIDGRPTVSLTLYKEKGTNTLRTARAVKDKLAAIRLELPGDLMFRIVDDESREVRKKLLELSLLAGVIVAVVFLMVFIVLGSLKPSLLILSSIAISVAITFNLIYVFRISMNMLTLGALALGFGMFVDNSIVVYENILRLRERGVPPRQAAVQGPREVTAAVLASTLTTVSVFFLFPYFQGRLRIYYLPLAFVMVSALSASLLVSTTLIPSLSLHLVRTTRRTRIRKGGAGFERLLRLALRHPFGVLVLVVALFTGSCGWFRTAVATGEFPRWYSKERLYVSIGLPPGTDIEVTDGVIRRFEDKVLEADLAKEIHTYVLPERASAAIAFPPDVERSSRPLALKEQLIQLAAQLAGIDCGITGFDLRGYSSSLGTDTQYGSAINLFGYNLKTLKQISSELARTLVRNPKIKDFRIFSGGRGWWRTDSLEYVIRLERQALAAAEVSPDEIFDQLQPLIRGRLSASLRATIGGREIALAITFPEADVIDLKGLQNSLLRTASGKYIRLGDVSRLEERPVAGSIDRENQQYQQTVSWEFRGPARSAEKFQKALLAGLRLPPGFSAAPDEPWRMTTEEKTEMKSAVAFSLILITMILAALYESFLQPFYILLAVPLGLIGVFLAFVFAGAAFDASAYIGVVLLGGIVVNNAILLVDHVNLKRRQGAGLLEAVLEGARERVRPVLMTAGTTVFGILPLLFFRAEAGRGEIWSSLALCTAGGLVSSTALILVVVPVCYFYGDRLKPWLAGRLKGISAGRKG